MKSRLRTMTTRPSLGSVPDRARRAAPGPSCDGRYGLLGQAGVEPSVYGAVALAGHAESPGRRSGRGPPAPGRPAGALGVVEADDRGGRLRRSRRRSTLGVDETLQRASPVSSSGGSTISASSATRPFSRSAKAVAGALLRVLGGGVGAVEKRPAGGQADLVLGHGPGAAEAGPSTTEMEWQVAHCEVLHEHHRPAPSSTRLASRSRSPTETLMKPSKRRRKRRSWRRCASSGTSTARTMHSAPSCWRAAEDARIISPRWLHSPLVSACDLTATARRASFRLPQPAAVGRRATKVPSDAPLGRCPRPRAPPGRRAASAG